MRHRRKWGRRWWFDVVWSGKDLKEVRVNGNWLPIERFNRVSFFGPTRAAGRSAGMIQLDEEKAAEARRELETLRALLWNDSRVAFTGWCERLDHVIKLLRVPSRPIGCPLLPWR
jgi:hypothetical protein